jgi:hypothetical protein
MTEVMIALVCCVAMFVLGFGAGMIFARWTLEYEWKKEGNVVEKRQERQKDRDYILNGRPKNF